MTRVRCATGAAVGAADAGGAFTLAGGAAVGAGAAPGWVGALDPAGAAPVQAASTSNESESRRAPYTAVMAIPPRAGSGRRRRDTPIDRAESKQGIALRGRDAGEPGDLQALVATRGPEGAQT